MSSINAIITPIRIQINITNSSSGLYKTVLERNNEWTQLGLLEVMYEHTQYKMHGEANIGFSRQVKERILEKSFK